jgi:CTP:phosphocholine cytidylyltransferase-like protein
MKNTLSTLKKDYKVELVFMDPEDDQKVLTLQTSTNTIQDAYVLSENLVLQDLYNLGIQELQNRPDKTNYPSLQTPFEVLSSLNL